MKILKNISECSNKLLHFKTRYYHSQPVRVRFAPSPTGFIHLGGLRTSLFNYLFAKKHSGQFILRIEDTDQERVVPESMESIFKMLQWTNLIPDEGPTFGGKYGPYIQSERVDLYREMIEKLLQTESVYRCFCTPKRLELLRREATKNREIPKYDNRCRSLSSEEIKQNLFENKPFTVRLKLKEGPITVNDLIFGPVTYDLSKIEGDPIIFKSNGLPTYHFANVVDDYFMEITHILRGIEWMISTPKHLMLYEAFGWKFPQYAHLPLLINSDGSKMSKRHDHLRISYFRDKGFYSLTMVNYLSQIGKILNSSHYDKINSLDELANTFDLKSINTNNCKIDIEKIRFLNRLYMQNLLQTDRDFLLNDLKTLLQDNKDKFYDEIILDDNYVEKILNYNFNRIYTLKDLMSDEFLYLWSQPKLTWTIENLQTSSNYIVNVLKTTLQHLKQIHYYDFEDKDILLKKLREVNKNELNEMNFNLFMKLLRLSLTNLKVGAPVAETMSLLGKDRTIKYLLNAIYYVHHSFISESSE